MTTKPAPRTLTLQEFTVFVRKASPAQIAKLKPEYLPEDIPEELIEDAPYETRGAIENLLFEANAQHMNLQMEVEAAFGEQVSTAISLGKQEGHSRAHREFDRKVKTLVEVYNTSKTEPSILKAEATEQLRIELRSLALDLRQESGAFAHAEGYLKKAQIDCSEQRFTKLFDKSLTAVKSKFERIMKSMNIYTYVRVLEVANEMDYVRNYISSLENEVGMLKQDAAELREQLKNLTSSFIGRRRNAKRIEELQDQISDILDDINRKEVVISEEDMLDWLDVIVDANLSDSVAERAERTLRLAKVNLFSLLQKYCILQESGARQVAQNPFSQIDPKQSIQYMLRSEKFILDYFLKKRDMMTVWLGDAAEAKLKALDGIEDKVLKELKKNNKLNG